jgi:hypothetical protein
MARCGERRADRVKAIAFYGACLMLVVMADLHGAAL